MGIDSPAVLLNRFDAIGRGTPAFIGDGGIERRHVDEVRRLGAENEWIVGDTSAVDLGVDGEVADASEALAGVAVDAAVEEVRSNEVL